MTKRLRLDADYYVDDFETQKTVEGKVARLQRELEEAKGQIEAAKRASLAADEVKRRVRDVEDQLQGWSNKKLILLGNLLTGSDYNQEVWDMRNQLDTWTVDDRISLGRELLAHASA